MTMDGRSEFLAYLGTATATIVVLFGAQVWYASYLDVSVVHGQGSEVASSAKVAEVRAQERQKLGKLDEAKDALAKRGRAGFPAIAAKPSEDLSAMSGWVYEPGFAAYVPQAQPAPEPAPAATAGDGGVAPEGESAAAPETGAAAQVEAAVEVVRQMGTGGLGVTKPATKPAPKPAAAPPAAPAAPQAPEQGH
jgi:hypothetical protein